MTKSELKQIIKSLIVESINESKNSVSIKKTKKLKEQEEMEPANMDAAADVGAGEVAGPEEPQDSNDEIMNQIDSIIGSLNSLKTKLSGETEEPAAEPEGEEAEAGEEELNQPPV